MSQFLTAQVAIEGVRPILWHAFGPDSIPIEKQEKTGVAGNDPEEWRRTVLMTTERQLYIKPSYVFGCIREGGRHVPKKRGTMMLDISGTMQVADPIIYIDRYVPEEPLINEISEPVYLDVSGVKNPATKGRNIRYRVAACAGWHCSFNLFWDGTMVSRSVIEQAIIAAGQVVGLGDGRSIGNGRFIMLSFEVSNAAKTPAA